MSRIYESMFLIDNDAVRAGWREAKASVTALVEKHGGRVLAARRWDERKLAYPIRRRRRATFLLAHCELPPLASGEMRRELDISETILRYLMIRVESVPPAEIELTQAEAADDFQVPEPPADDARDVEPEPEPAEGAGTAEAKGGEGEAAADDAKEGDGASTPDSTSKSAPETTDESEPVSATTSEPSRGDS